ncbi:MAG: D-alanyl-D-alanine carboxypeptidase/D-alanyl-D-alanine-endopeptidase [Actinomycetota bacterium]|nr:D-alanyl-D-alanine carboxypeptidase/D-alanyl-D-alanine-endopeptidase [Actinomycetota bacterium]
MRGRVLIVVLLLVAVACAAVAVWPEVAPRPGTNYEAVPTTPVFSLRRAPTVLSDLIADGRLVDSLEKAFADPALGPARDRACLTVRDAGGRPVYDRNGDVMLIPASNMKIFTGLAALTRLGAQTRLVTEVEAARTPTGGVVEGDLWLVGGGDPLLAVADFAAVAGYLGRPRLSTSMESLADRVVASGVREVRGRVLGDESRYDTQRYVPTWNPTYATESEIGPMSALTVNGGFVQWRPRAVPAPAPATNGAAVLTALLRQRGVVVAGEAGEGRVPAGAAAVASIESPPIAEIVAVLLRESDNLTAELLVKELGVRFGGNGSTSAGLKVMRDTLASMGLPIDDYSAVDGSGLDRSDRLSCDLLEAALAHVGQDGPLAESLPLAGQDGTLTRRFVGTPAAGRIRAKTGSLQGVIGLSGWATGQDGRPVQFSFLANDLPRGPAGDVLETRVVSALVAYPQAPSPAELGPEAPRPVSDE